MSNEIQTPNRIDKSISWLNTSCDNSCPPLNPIDNNKYNDINFEVLGGISKSLFISTAITPNTKNKSAGFVKLSINKL